MPESESSENVSTHVFTLPQLNENLVGWGPNNVPDKYQDLPYQKFSKSDRIGKIADWNMVSMHNTDKKNLKYQPQFALGNVGGQYAYFHDEDESQFTLVDQSRVKAQYQKKFKNVNNKNNRRFFKPGGGYQAGGKPKQDNNNKEYNKPGNNKLKSKNYTRNPRNQIKPREPSVKVKDDWKMIEEIEFSRLAKLSLPSVENPADLKLCGSLEYYDKNYDRINTRVITATNKFKRINRVYHNVTTSDDPVIRQLAKTEEGNVYASDSIISTLMCCSRSVYPWDIVVSKFRGMLFFDKREDSNFDLLTVGETSSDPPHPDDSKNINSAYNLALEATFINHNLAQQVLLMNKERYTFPEPNPFIEGDESEIASKAYKYRKWDLGNNVRLIVRSEVDAVTTGANDEKKFLNIKALNEWDPKANAGLDWRKKLDAQPGAVLAAEIKNNGCKLAKWTACSLLAGVDQIKFGFVSRANPRATDNHLILGMQQFKPEEFAGQIAMNMDNAWGIVRCIVDILNKQPDGKYVIMKDPNKPIIRIYEVPENSLSEDEDGDQYDNEDN